MLPPLPVILPPNAPKWALPLWYDYTQQRGSPALGFPPGTDTHAAPIYGQALGGGYQSFGANVPVITNLGQQTVPTVAQLLAAPIDYTAGSWGKSNCNAIADQAVAPDGTTTADAMAPTASPAGGASMAQSGVAVAAASVYTFYAWVKNGALGNNWIELTMISTSTWRAWFNLATGAAGSSSGSPTRYAITAYGNGWYLCEMTVTAGTTTMRCDLAARTADASTGNIPNGDGVTPAFYAWAANLRLGAFSVAPVLAQQTTAGNQPVITGLGLVAGVGGLIQLDIRQAAAAFTRLFEVSDGVNGNNRLTLAFSGANVIAEMFSATVSQASLNLGAPIVGVNTFAFAFSSNFVNAQRIGGSAPGAVTSATYPTTNTQLALLSSGYSAGNNSYGSTRKLGLSFGVQDATTYAAILAKATLAAAA